MPISVIVFDLDGTLIDSNQLKYDAFFKLFPSNEFHVKIITEVISEFLEKSRYTILREALKRLEGCGDEMSDIEAKINELANKYDMLATSGAKTCKEKMAAGKVLKYLSSKYRLYLSSTTPKNSLRDIVKYRKWEHYFCDIFGYPKNKVSALNEIIHREQITPDEILVIGDGESDRSSASEVGCRFYMTREDGDLEKLQNFIGELEELTNAL